MISDWQECRIADLCDSIDYGFTTSAKELPVGPRFLRITDIVSGHIDWKSVPHCEIDAEDIPGVRLNHGDVVIARTGATTGVSAYITNPPDAVFASYLVRLKVGPKADARFISYFLKSADFWNYMRGVLGDKSAQPNASARTMTQVKLRKPPLPVQRSIASVLGVLDDKIELNRRMNETLEALARALFQNWFVDATQAGLPKGWREGKVNDLATLSRDGLNPGEFPDETFDHYSIPAFDEGRTPKPEIGDTIKSNKFIVSPDCVLISKLNPRIPRVWLPDLRSANRAICSTEFLVTTPKSGMSREFLFCLFTNETFVSMFTTMVTGTSGSHQRVKPESLLGMDAVIPPQSLIQSFTEMTAPLLERINHNIADSRTLAALRDALLPKLLSGELRVPAKLTEAVA